MAVHDNCISQANKNVSRIWIRDIKEYVDRDRRS